MSPADYSRRRVVAEARGGREKASAQAHSIPVELAGMRLDQALARLFPSHSRTRLRAWIDAGRVTVNAETWEAARRVAGGEHVDVAPLPAEPSLIDAPQNIALSIVFEDDSILVVDKPAGLVVHPGSGNREGTLLNALLHHDAALATVPRAGIVHRLDKDTSGLIVVAKTIEAQTDLVRKLAARRIAREYLALARGDLARATIVDAPIGRHPTKRTTMAVVARGKPARTHVAIAERFGIATLLRVTLETGRTHQIRVHLAAIGHPLVGDPAYGGKWGQRRNSASAVPARADRSRSFVSDPKMGDFPRQALHATRLSLPHPRTNESMSWESSPPDDFANLVHALRSSCSAAR